MPDDEPDMRPGDEADDASAPDEGARGRMRFQDETTTPREPTLAERRAREVAQRRAEETERRETEERERSARKRKRILVGAGVTVGVVALIAVGYSVAQPDDDVQAQCVDDDGVIVDDSNCVTPASASGTSNYGGGGFFPIFIGGGGRQYHYTYGGTGSIGQRVQGGTTTVPKEGTRVTTSSGRSVAGPSSSGSVSRGGLGVSGGGSSSGS